MSQVTIKHVECQQYFTYLVSLPDLQLHAPAKLLVSLVLSPTIEYKKRKNALCRLTKNPSKYPKSANLKFKLYASSLIKNLENLEALRSETNLKVDDF